MSNTLVFFVACMGPNWRRILTEQLERIRKGVIYDTAYVLIAHDSVLDGQEAGRYVRMYLDRAKITMGYKLSTYEFPAMQKIWELAQLSKEGVITYLHTKGVSYANDEQANWRDIMMHWVVDNNALAIREISEYNFDCWGFNWQKFGAVSHFSGNFWVATKEYLASLTPWPEYLANPVHDMGKPDDIRLSAEMWAGSSSRPIKFASKGCVNVHKIWTKLDSLCQYQKST